MEITIIYALIIGLSLIVSSIIMGMFISKSRSKSNIGAFQIIKLNEREVLILDTRTGQYWRKSVDSNISSENHNEVINRFV